MTARPGPSVHAQHVQQQQQQPVGVAERQQQLQRLLLRLAFRPCLRMCRPQILRREQRTLLALESR
jgi:hypothetical protein